MSRRSLLGGALGVVAAGSVLAACRSPASSDTPLGATPSTEPPTSPAGPPDWNALAQELDGEVTLPSSAAFGQAKRVFNARFDTSTPLAVVAASSLSDVQKAVAFAARHRTAIAARSGGHSYVGASTADGTLVLDLRSMPAEPTFAGGDDLVTVPAAADLDAVQTALAARGRSIPSGSCPTVGIAGLALGGGLGSDGRRSGLTCDALVSAAVVLPSGEAVTASADDHDDLFWALRGGGGGNFGVTTSLTFRTSPVADREVVTLVFDGGATRQVLLGWDGWLRAADRSIWGMVNATVDSGATRCTVVLAAPPGNGTAAGGQLATAIGVQPVSTSSRTLGRLEFVHYFEGGAQATQPRAFVAGSDVIGEMTDAAAASIVAALAAWPQDTGAATAIVESLSGAIGDVAPAATAFPWRRQAANIQWYTEPPTPAGIDAATGWLSTAHDAVRDSSVGAYVNYLEPGVSAARYFGDNLARLVEVRDKYDPDGVMHAGVKY